MQVTTGTVVGGKVVVEGVHLIEGSVVAVLSREPDEPFALSTADEDELLASMAEIDRGEFVSVADAVHQPSILKLVVQKHGQISAIRLVAALIVILPAWRMRSASLLWKLTLAISMLLVALGLSPLLPNAWQSVVDGVALGALLSVVMAMVCGCVKCCECPWTWMKRRMVSAV